MLNHQEQKAALYQTADPYGGVNLRWLDTLPDDLQEPVMRALCGLLEDGKLYPSWDESCGILFKCDWTRYPWQAL